MVHDASRNDHSGHCVHYITRTSWLVVTCGQDCSGQDRSGQRLFHFRNYIYVVKLHIIIVSRYCTMVLHHHRQVPFEIIFEYNYIYIYIYIYIYNTFSFVILII